MVRTILFLLSLGIYVHASCVASLLYFQDCHEVVPVPRHNATWGGLARLATVLKAHNTSHTDIVFGGDLAGGTLFGAVYKGVPMIDAFNQLGVSLANFGQHDFDFGYRHTLDLRRESHFPWISSNLLNASTHMPFVNTTHIVRQHGNLCVGYLGLTTDMNSTVDAGILEEPIIDASRRAVAALGDVDAIVAVTQLNNASAWALMQAVPSIRVLLHEEDSAESLGSVDKVSPGRFIVSPRGDYGTVTEVSFAKTDVDTEVHIHVYNVDGSVPEDPEFLCLQTKLERALNETLAERVGTAPQPFSAAETGYLVTDSYRHQSGAQLAWQGSGGIRATIPAGPITLRSLYSVLPFGNALAVICVTGADVETALQRTLGAATDTTSFPYVSGMEYAYTRYGAHYRLVNVTVDGRRLDTRAPYTLVLPNFHVSDVFSNATFQTKNISTDVFALIHAVQAWHTVRPSPSRSILVS
ncbi:hypothetical protein MNAN1_003031 [Malassezia nana]|uniref:5'-Nucleotidase C-terminal domain-containing protein n=1 Tax=Malassezia nana TaxID=180528 RepID=A0AAF0EP11_9BASI|nr:hypothetical protein MNAN1_003031 [Malassezia nana]